MVAQVGPLWTVEEYLLLERYSTVKHEYHGGYVYAMAGGSQAHSQIAGNMYALLRAGVRGSGCRALNPDIKIRQAPDDYVYADAVVTCDPRDDVPGQDWIDYPTLVVEVWRRAAAGAWTSTVYGPADDVVLDSLALTLPMDLIYEDSGL